MHELGICDAMLKMVRGIIKDDQLEDVAVTDGTELDGVEFVIEELEGTAACMDCGEEFPVGLTSAMKCPHCGSAKLTPLTGRDLTMKEILAT